MALVRQQFILGGCRHQCHSHDSNTNYNKEEKRTTKMTRGAVRIPPSSSSQSFASSFSASRGLTAATKASAASAVCVTLSTSGTSAEGIAGDIRWGWSCLQGPRSEMEDDVVVRSDSLHGFDYAAVFDGHAGFSSVQFLRLEEVGTDIDSGSTATVMFVGGDMLIISHVGDSSVVLSRSGKTEVLTSPHRPYGSSKTSLQEIKRIKEAGGWVVDGRICGEISVSRSFGDIRFKTKKNEMLEKGVEEGRWTRKFISRVKMNGDWVTATPDIYQVALGMDAEFLILASDGLWDYMSCSDAVRFVRNQLCQHGDVQSACEALALAALNRKSQDNVSVVIADLGRTNWQAMPPDQEQVNIFIEFSQAFATIGIVSLGIWLSHQFVA
ncbi:protein phosphatase 2C 57 isoform X2 [Nymphaea colorata]|uniref:protein phosphatase 2C 57 isoform X2 n=1 Tax=Nymphaea colorata TaxID=210225 RepID=UPI00129E1EBC|nr:protein phosphatase 2C 57 isoform X2 [Nymphaea colorata]